MVRPSVAFAVEDTFVIALPPCRSQFTSLSRLLTTTVGSLPGVGKVELGEGHPMKGFVDGLDTCDEEAEIDIGEFEVVEKY